MNIKNIMSAFLCALISQLTLATSFTVYYDGSKPDHQRHRILCNRMDSPIISVRPVWTNGPQDFFQLYCPDENYMRYVKTSFDRRATSHVDYTTLLHKLRGIEWKAGNNCYYVDLEQFDISRVNISTRIYLYYDGTCGIDIDGNAKITYITGTAGSCNNK